MFRLSRRTTKLFPRLGWLFVLVYSIFWYQKVYKSFDASDFARTTTYNTDQTVTNITHWDEEINNNTHKSNVKNNELNSVINYTGSKTPMNEGLISSSRTSFVVHSPNRPILTAYLESSSLSSNESSRLRKIEFPEADKNHNNGTNLFCQEAFPIIDDYPEGDAYLPWIHDIFLLENSNDNLNIKNKLSLQVIAQNRRRCHTGNITYMQLWEGQVALFQPVSIVVDENDVGEQVFRFSTPIDHNNTKASLHDETRFRCQWKIWNSKHQTLMILTENITFSKFPFNYEYVHQTKTISDMFKRKGKDDANFWLSQLMFHCPVPDNLIITETNEIEYFVDIIPIRTPARLNSKDHQSINLSFLPQIEHSGRWENIPVCISPILTKSENKTIDAIHRVQPDKETIQKEKKKKMYDLVACTWTSAYHNRRGDQKTIYDGTERLLEWIQFHLLTGFDHIYVYDNTPLDNNHSTSELKVVTNIFPSTQVTHIKWPCKVCNNNRPNHKYPGERSSQYAAEASCRLRYGHLTEWMATMDPDEYFVPSSKSWKDVLEKYDKQNVVKILKFKSSRARPRLELLDSRFSYRNDPESTLYPSCSVDHPKNEDVEQPPCLFPRKNETFLKTYSCDYIKNPKPERFQRAMKQIFKPDFVLSHFVHYSVVTKETVQNKSRGKLKRNHLSSERFADEIKDGIMIHSKSSTPDELVNTKTSCKHNPERSKNDICVVGIPCPDHIEFDDVKHKGGFLDKDGKFCNCWLNQNLEDYWIPKLEKALKNLKMGQYSNTFS